MKHFASLAHLALLAGSLAAGSMLAGCAADAAPQDAAPQDAAPQDAESADERQADADLVSGAGVSFVGSADAALRVTAKVADGVQPSTRNNRFVRLTVARGAKSFGMWCTGAGQIGAAGEHQKLECFDGVETVSDDDDESFSLTLARKGGAYEIESVDYIGDGTLYGDRMAVLQPGWSWQGGAPYPLEHIALAVKHGAGTSSDPFVMVASVGARLKGLLGTEVANHETRPLPVESARFTLSKTMELDATLLLTRSGRVTASSGPVSVLETPGALASGLAAASTVKGRVLAKVH